MTSDLGGKQPDLCFFANAPRGLGWKLNLQGLTRESEGSKTGDDSITINPMQDTESSQMNHALGKACRAAVEYGIDLSELDSSLALTPLERLICHDQALELVYAARQAGILHYGIHSRLAETPEGT